MLELLITGTTKIYMCLLFPFESNFLFPIKRWVFVKALLRKNFFLVPRTSFCGCVTPLTWMRLLPACIAVGSWMMSSLLHLAIIVGTVLTVNMFCPLPVSLCEMCVCRRCRVHLAHGAGTSIWDQFMLTLILWPHVCIPSPHKAKPHVLPRLGAAALGPFFRSST